MTFYYKCKNCNKKMKSVIVQEPCCNNPNTFFVFNGKTDKPKKDLLDKLEDQEVDEEDVFERLKRLGK